MLTTAQPESHIHRSIFILPAAALFVNATRVQAIGNACVTGGAAILTAITGPLTLDAEGLAEKICFSLFNLPPVFNRVRAQVLRQANSCCSIRIDDSMH